MALVAGLIATAGLATKAGAGITVDLLFVGHNGASIAPTNSVNANPGETLDLAVIFTNDVDLFSITFTLASDLGLGQVAPTAKEWAGVALNPGKTAIGHGDRRSRCASTRTRRRRGSARRRRRSTRSTARGAVPEPVERP